MNQQLSEKERNYTIDDGSGEHSGVLGRKGVMEHLAALLDDDHILEDGKTLAVKISRHDMTAEEIAALPEL